MSLSPKETVQTLMAARQLPLNAPAERVEDFISQVLNLNPIQQAEYFPGPDPQGLLAVAVANLTGDRERVLRVECAIPTFAVYEDNLGVYEIAGLSTYLRSKGYDDEFLGRLAHHEQIGVTLRRLERGQHLEALAAAVMYKDLGYGEATQGTGDQGIDAIGWKELIMINAAFSDGSVSVSQVLPGEKVFLFASSKAVIGKIRVRQKLLNPAHIRELVGGWVIQRSSVGMWQEVGIRMLSPVQMVLVTTYRLSPGAKSECRGLGIQVWGIPELIYLICKFAPATVFDAGIGFEFSASAFRSWWKERDLNRFIARR